MHTPAGFTPSHVLPAALPGDAHAFAFRGDRVLVVVGADETLTIPALETLRQAGVSGGPHFLGLLGGTGCVALNLADDASEPAGMRYVGLRTLFFKVPEPLLALATRAFQIVDWDRCHRYCGRCATPTLDRA